MLEKVPSTLILEWMAYSELEPFGTDADYLGHAIVASAVTNANRTKNFTKPEDFMPKFRKEKQSVEQMMQIAEMFTVGMGGKDKRNG